MSRPTDEDRLYVSPQYERLRSSYEPRFRALAVAVGFFVNLGFNLCLGIYVGAVAIVRGLDPSNFEVLVNALNEMPLLLFLAGMCGTLIGAYVAAWMGSGLPVQHAFAVGVVSLIVNLPPALALPELQPLWVTALSAVLTIPAALLGGAIRLIGERSRVVT